MLEIPKVTVSRDISFLREQSKKILRNIYVISPPLKYNKCISSLEAIIKESWIITTKVDKLGNNQDELSSLALIKDTYSEKMDLLTNASLLQDSIKFVTENKLNLICIQNNFFDLQKITCPNLKRIKITILPSNRVYYAFQDL